jgi:hypothetical protein
MAPSNFATGKQHNAAVLRRITNGSAALNIDGLN